MENAQRDEYTAPTMQPERSVATVVPLDEIENAVTRTALNYWHMLRRGRKMPARSELSPRDMRAILHNIVLIRVIDGGRDYEYRIVGGVFAWAYDLNFQGMFLTPDRKHRARGTARACACCTSTSAPTANRSALHGWVGRDVTDCPFVYYESVVLPFGDDGDDGRPLAGDQLPRSQSAGLSTTRARRPLVRVRPTGCRRSPPSIVRGLRPRCALTGDVCVPLSRLTRKRRRICHPSTSYPSTISTTLLCAPALPIGAR